MEGKRISTAEVAAFRALSPTAWKTAAQIAAEAGIAGRTSRLHLARLTEIGLAERAEVHDGYRYKGVPRPHPRAAEHLAALNLAAEAFGSEVVVER